MHTRVPLSAIGYRLSAMLALGMVVVVLMQSSLSDTPLNLISSTRGLYAPEPGADFAWTTSQLSFPIPLRAGPSQLQLRLSAGLWPGRQPAHVSLSNNRQIIAQWTAAEQPRQYLLLLPACSSQLTLQSDVARPERGDPRFLGLRLYTVNLRASGFDLGKALALGLGGIIVGLLAVLLYRASLRGWALPLAVTVLALGLRLFELEQLPAGFFQDEAVSIVDASSLLQTGRDHYGVFLPLGAFEAFGDWVSPLLTYVQLPFALVLGTTPLAARLPAALAGTLAVPALYALARSLGVPRAAALLAALVVAVSPWQILRSRVASPPALVPLCWTLCVWAAVMLIRSRNRRAALVLAVASGFAVYSYPTMKLAVPLLTGAGIVLASIQDYRSQKPVSLGGLMRALTQRWWPAAVLLTILWIPFAQLTLFNANSGMRASRKIIQADSWVAWLSQWLDGYSRYFRPDFYFLSGDPSNGISGQGVELTIEALLVLPGLALLIYVCLRSWPGQLSNLHQQLSACDNRLVTLSILIALLIAPLPASLMSPNPHLTRALIMAPMFALLVGIGSWAVLELLQGPGVGGRGSGKGTPDHHSSRRQTLISVTIAAIILWQGLARFEDYRSQYPALVAHKYQDGMREAVALLVQNASSYDAVWVDDSMPFPYIYVLATGGVSAQETHATLVVNHPGTTFNTVQQVGKYEFRSLKDIPYSLPTLAATVNSLGEPGYVIQELEQRGQQILLLRRMIR